MEKVLVIGSARSGNAVSCLLVEKGYEVYLTDQRDILDEQSLRLLGVHTFGNGHPDSLKHIDYSFVVKNPGIPYSVPFVSFFVDKNVDIYSEIEVASWYPKNFKYAAITGTNGKTTTVSLLYHILNQQVNAYVAGNIGVPLSEVVLKHEQEEASIALELSNFQILGCKTFHPFVSVVCNLSPDHLDYMDSLDAYYRSKMKIYDNCKPSDFFLRNLDDETLMMYATDIPCQIVDYSLKQFADLHRRQDVYYYKEVALFHGSDLQLVGEHNKSNALVAAGMAYLMGIEPKIIATSIQTFYGVEHRLEFVAKIDGVLFYNDSKATNPEAVIPALEAFEENIILLAGGYDKHLDFTCLSSFNQRIKQCFAFGESAEQFIEVFDQCSTCENLEEAFEKALQIARPKDIILLSPACASYDQFQSYEERGNEFKKLVERHRKETK